MKATIKTKTDKPGSEQRMVRQSRTWISGYPKLCGYYDCKLDDGRTEIVHYYPGMDSEIHPYGKILNIAINAHRRIPGELYRDLRDA